MAQQPRYYKLERVWRTLCQGGETKRFILSDVHAALLVHDAVVTPREAVLTMLEKRDARASRAMLLEVCRAGHVLEALCWLYARHPHLLRHRKFRPEAVPPHLRHDEQRGPAAYRELQKSVARWLRAWSHFV